MAADQLRLFGRAAKKQKQKRNLVERGIQQSICDWLAIQRRLGLCQFWIQRSTGTFDKARGVFLRDPNPYVVRGISDIVCLWRPKGAQVVPVFIEVKTEDGRLSDAQIAFQEAVRGIGAVYILARSLNDAIVGLSRIPI